jgi:uncharacterized protein
MPETSLLDMIAFFVLWLGHACTLLFLLNMAYSRPWDKEFRKFFRMCIGLCIFLLPPAYYLWRGFSFTLVGENIGVTFIDTILWFYIPVCFVSAGVILPAVTYHRLTRKPPLCVRAETTETFDLQAEAGTPLVGHGKLRALTKLPGNGVFKADFTTLELGFDDLPAAWDGTTILHLSDLHFIGTPDRPYFEQMMKHCLAWGTPDLVMLTGDIVDTPKHHRWIIPILGQLRWQTAAYAILGNHDWWQDHERVRRRLRKIGMHVLGNTWAQTTHRGLPLVVIGNECPWFTPEADLRDCPPEGFRMCLSHTPDHINWAIANNIRLMLSGHNHGGQIRLPVFGSLFVPSWYSRRYDMGTFEKAGTVMHVNRGAASKEPLRINCNAQVTWIVLRKGRRQDGSGSPFDSSARKS